MYTGLHIPIGLCILYHRTIHMLYHRTVHIIAMGGGGGGTVHITNREIHRTVHIIP